MEVAPANPKSAADEPMDSASDQRPTVSDPADSDPTDPNPTTDESKNSKTQASITHLAASSIFAAPTGTLLLHACNARGAWGAGVAAAFKSQYPRAFKIYNDHCLHPPAPSKPGKEWQESLVGTCLVIPPQGKDKEGEKGHWVGCLFTSWGYGKQVDGVEEIVESTRKAVADLKGRLEELGKGEGEEAIQRVWSVKINSGMFGVEWERTEEVLGEGGVDMVIVTPKEGEGTGKKRRMFTGQGKGDKKAKRNGDHEGSGEVDDVSGVGKGNLRRSGREGKQGGLDGWLK